MSGLMGEAVVNDSDKGCFVKLFCEHPTDELALSSHYPQKVDGTTRSLRSALAGLDPRLCS